MRAYGYLEDLLVHPEWLTDPQNDKQALLLTEKTCLACSGREMYLEYKECSFTRKSYLNTPSGSRYLRFPRVLHSPTPGGVPEYRVLSAPELGS